MLPRHITLIDCELYIRINVFRLIEHPYNSNNIFLYLKFIIEKYGIHHMIRSFTFKNALLNKLVIDKFINELRPEFDVVFFHTLCVCNIINLIVQYDLVFIKSQLEKIDKH